MANIEIITTADAFRGLKDEWNDLLSRSSTNAIFLTWEWLYSWWEVFGRGAKLFIIVSKDDQGNLNGIAPLHIRKTRYYKFPIKELTFIGMGHSDRQDFIAAENIEDVTDNLLKGAFDHKAEWDVMHLEQIPEQSYLLKSKTAKNLGCFIEESSVCPFVHIEGDWDTYSKTLGKKFRRDIQHKINRLTRFGPWELRVDNHFDDPRGTISLSESIERKSRKEGTEKGFLANEANRQFLSGFGEACKDKGWLDYSHIKLDRINIAYLIGFVYDAKYYAYNMAFNETYREASPGKLLLNEKIKWCFQRPENIYEFDFLRGAFYLKSLWATSNRQHYRIVIFNGSRYSKLLRSLVFLVRPKVKRLTKKIMSLILKTREIHRDAGTIKTTKLLLFNVCQAIMLPFYTSLDFKVLIGSLENVSEYYENPSDPYHCKRLEEKDLPGVEKQFGKEIRDNFVRRMQESAKGHLIIYQDDVIGYAWASSELVSGQGSPAFLFDVSPREGTVYFYDDYIIPRMRGKGVNSKLKHFHLWACKLDGYSEVLGITERRNVAQIKILEKAGWTERGRLTYRKYLWFVKKDTSSLIQFCKESCE